MADSDRAIVLTKLTRRFGADGGVVAVDGIDTTIQAGVITGLVGPDGAGKTTLIRAITGELPSTGGLALNGRDIRSTPAPLMATMRAVLAQSTPLSFPFTVAEVVRLGAGLGEVGDLDVLAADLLGRVLEGVEARRDGQAPVTAAAPVIAGTAAGDGEDRGGDEEREAVAHLHENDSQ